MHIRFSSFVCFLILAVVTMSFEVRANTKACNSEFDINFTHKLETLDSNFLTFCKSELSGDNITEFSITHNLKRTISNYLDTGALVPIDVLFNDILQLKEINFCTGLRVEVELLIPKSTLFEETERESRLGKLLHDVVEHGLDCKIANSNIRADAFIKNIVMNDEKYSLFRTTEMYQLFSSDLLRGFNAENAFSSRALGLLVIRDLGPAANEAVEILTISSKLGNLNAQLDLGVLALMGNVSAKIAYLENTNNSILIPTIQEMCRILEFPNDCTTPKNRDVKILKENDFPYNTTFFQLRNAVGEFFDW